jgi:hypothetical protein
MEQQERDLIRRFMDGYTLYAELNGRRYQVVYSSRHDGDPLPWINLLIGPSLRFPNDTVKVHVVTCKVCGAEVGPGIKARAGFPVMDLCERDAVAELAGDLVQIENGHLK